MFIQTKKRIWLITMSTVLLGTLLSVFFAYKVLLADDTTDPLAFAIGCALLISVAFGFIIAEIELFLAIRYFLFCNTKTSSITNIVNKMRLIISSIIIGIDLLSILVEWFAYTDWEMIFTLSVCYIIGCVLLRIISVINWFYIKSRDSKKSSTNVNNF